MTRKKAYTRYTASAWRLVFQMFKLDAIDLFSVNEDPGSRLLWGNTDEVHCWLIMWTEGMSKCHSDNNECLLDAIVLRVVGYCSKSSLEARL